SCTTCVCTCSCCTT
uniref:Thiocillin n=4 Tax=Bacillales TaxID=1385 RepID=THCL_BACBA|nr:RecName: Full=Thiocillin [Bacillus cereus]P0C8P7.1 RecName: Full=Thiocillin [Bacillus badius]